jgi:hypothetical protein
MSGPRPSSAARGPDPGDPVNDGYAPSDRSGPDSAIASGSDRTPGRGQEDPFRFTTAAIVGGYAGVLQYSCRRPIVILGCSSPPAARPAVVRLSG